MRNFKKIFLIGVAVLALGFASCSEQKSDKKDATVYNVSCVKSDYYSFSGTTSATSGLKATVKITSQYPAFEITGCTFNGNSCTKTSAENTTAQEFEYIMPQSDVEIKVLYKWNDLEVSGKDNFLCFDSSNVYSMKSAWGDADYNNDINWGTPLILSFDLFNKEPFKMMDSAYGNIIDCFSSNQNILPNDAIQVNETKHSSNNSIIGGKIAIDRSKAHVGSTQIVLRVKNGNKEGYDAIIVKTITITE